jgi:hypothetical protein
MKLGLPYHYHLNPKDPTEPDRIVNHWTLLQQPARLMLERCGHVLTSPPKIPQGTTHVNTPLRLFRNMVSPELTCSAEADRSLLVLGMAKSWRTTIVAEVQALWGAVYLLGGFDSAKGDERELRLVELGRDGIEESVMLFEEFSEGTGGSVSVVDPLKVGHVGF